MTGADRPLDGDVTQWEGFARALSDELVRLPMEAVLILAERDDPKHFVQFLQDTDELQAEAAGGDFGDPIGSLSVRDRRLLDAVGWREPTLADEAPTWQYPLPWPATTEEYRRLATAVVTALRDVQEVATPANLVYRSWESGGRRRAVRLPGVGPDEGYVPEGYVSEEGVPEEDGAA